MPPIRYHGGNGIMRMTRTCVARRHTSTHEAEMCAFADILSKGRCTRNDMLQALACDGYRGPHHHMRSKATTTPTPTNIAVHGPAASSCLPCRRMVDPNLHHGFIVSVLVLATLGKKETPAS